MWQARMLWVVGAVAGVLLFIGATTPAPAAEPLKVAGLPVT